MKAILFLMIILILGINSTAAAEERISTISVSGEGVIEVAPDRATISVGVVTRDKNAAKVQNDNARIANARHRQKKYSHGQLFFPPILQAGKQQARC